MHPVSLKEPKSSYGNLLFLPYVQLQLLTQGPTNAHCQYTAHVSTVQRWGWGGITPQPARKSEENSSKALESAGRRGRRGGDLAGLILISAKNLGKDRIKQSPAFFICYWWLWGKALVQKVEIN